MAKKKERYGCLTETMIKFLNMNEEKRVATYGKNGVSKKYEKIRKNVQASFLDAQVAFGYLPKKQRKKIDLITSYNNLLEYVKRHKLAEDLPDVPIRMAINQLKATYENFSDSNLKKFAGPEFKRFLNLLQLIESKSPSYETWDPTETSKRSTLSVA